MNLSEIAPWGQPGTPLVPWQFRAVCGDQPAPPILQRHYRGDGVLTVRQLDSQIWAQLDPIEFHQAVEGQVAYYLGGEWASVASEPVIPPGTILVAQIGDLPLRSRTRNILRRSGLLEERRPRLSIGDAMAWQGWGNVSLFDFLSVCEAAAIEASPEDLIARPKTRESVEEGRNEPQPVPEYDSLVHHFLEAAEKSGRFETIGELLVINPNASIPRFLSDIWSRAADLSLDSRSDGPASIPELLASLLESVNEREQRMLRERTFRTGNQPTLAQIGNQLGVTRERVRQLESRAVESLQNALSDSRFHPVSWLVHDLSDEFGNAIPVSIARKRLAERQLEDFTEMILWMCGPYSLQGSWLVREIRMKPKDGDQIVMPDGYEPPIPIEEAHDRLESAGIRREFITHWLHDARYLRVLDGHVALWKGSVADKAVSVLHIAGSPMTPEEICERIAEGHSKRTVRNTLFSDDRFRRTSKTEIGLADWGLEEYEGIVAEIDQYLEQHGGQVSVNQVVDAVSNQFGVSANSVQMYANTPRFVIEDEILRRRTKDDPFTIEGRVEDTAGVYRGDSAEEALLRIQVDRDVLRGSGRAIPTPLVGFLEMHLGEVRTFVARDDKEVVISWPDSSTTGPNLGSTRILAEQGHGEIGDFLFLGLNATGTLNYWTVHESELAKVSKLERAAALVGVDPVDSESQLVHAIGHRLWMSESTITRSDLRRACRKRGEEHLADLIPASPVAPEIAETLEALEDVL